MMNSVQDHSLTTVFKRLLEPLLIVIYLHLLTWVLGQRFDGNYWVLAIMTFFISSYIFAELHKYRMRDNPQALRLAGAILLDWGVVVGVLWVIGYVTDFQHLFSPQVLLPWIVVTPFGLFLTQSILCRFSDGMRQNGVIRTAVMIGVNEVSIRLADRIAEYPSLMMEVLGFFDDRDMSRQPAGVQIPLLGRMTDVVAYVREHGVNMIYISQPISAQPRIVQLMDDLQDTTASIYFIPDIYIFDLIQARFDYVGGLAVMAICETPFTGMNSLVKRASDIVLASIFQLLLLPIMLIIAASVKATSPGPVIFKQRRYGLGGEEIVVYKFRSMTVQEDGGDVVQAQKDDQRLTKIGGFLRRTSLDELPQFINVLQGRMSIVGPRPHAVAHNEFYRKQIKGYMLRHKVRPGITGWAQVNGFRGETETLDKMKTRIEFDLEYLRRWSLSLDLWIIFKTVKLVLKRDNAY
ncbi:MAG: UDP-phosphate glucose phosphotransferase [Herbaspirillum sp.]|jgi:putative colanic acid biosynthesis UDP-glucose lipid carrier transferase|nr:UDP-phosphate glucose phosphotransferase [Herbaspirillum sp.]